MQSIKLKTKEEIAIMQEGGKRHAQILAELGEMCKDGVSTLTLEEEARAMIRAMGDEPALLGYHPGFADRPYPAALCISINNEIVHGIPNEAARTLKDGDIVSIDLSLKHKGLITDAAITVPVGVVDDESRRLIHVTKLALEEGIKVAKPGNTVGDIGFSIAVSVKGSKFTLAEDLAGHGVGYHVHEEPLVPNAGIRGKGVKLVPGMVIAIEPMLNAGKPGIKLLKDGYTIVTKDGSRSAHFEHTVAITEEGNLVLTRN